MMNLLKKSRPPSQVLDRIISSSYSSMALGVDEDYTYLINFDAETISKGVRARFRPDDKIVYWGRHERFIVADWNKGLICQSAMSGDVIWHNPIITNITHLRLADDESSVAVSGGDPPRGLLVSVADGSILETFERVTQLFVQSDKKEKIIISTGANIGIVGNVKASATWGAFAVLDGLFVNNSIVLSGPGGVLGMYRLPDLQPVAPAFCPIPCVRVVPIYFSLQTRTIMGVVAEPYATAAWELFAFDINLQNARRIGGLGFARNYSFINEGRRLCTTSGKVFDTATCELVTTLNWPLLYKCNNQ